MKSFKASLAFFLSLLILILPAMVDAAATVHLKDGNVRRGEIIEQTESRIRLDTGDGNIHAFPIGDIEKVVREIPVEIDVINLNNGSVMKGVIIEESTARLKLRTSDGDIHAFFLSEIQMKTKEIDVRYETWVPPTGPGSEKGIEKVPKQSQPSLSIPKKEKSEDEDEGSVGSEVGFRVGYFLPTEEALREVYDSGGFVFGIDLFYWGASGWGFGFSLDYFRKSGTPLVLGDVENARAKIKIDDLIVGARYRPITSKSNIRPYFGIGGGFYRVEEKLTAVGLDISVEERPFGFQALAGMQIGSSGSFILEAKFSYASFSGGSGLAGNDVNIGGFTIVTGFRF